MATEDNINSEDFSKVFGSMKNSIEKQSSFLGNISNTVKASLNTAKTQAKSLMDMLTTDKLQLSMEEERARDQARRDRLTSVEDQAKSDPRDKFSMDKFADDLMKKLNMDDLSLSDLLKGVALAPFVLKFTQGFLKEITNGLLDISPSEIIAAMRAPQITAGLASLASSLLMLDKWANLKVFKNIANIGDAMRSGRAAAALGKIFNPIMTVFHAANKFIVGPIGKTLSSLAKLTGVSGALGFFGKLVWPLTILMGAWDAVTAWKNTEGTVWDKFVAGIGGFLGEIIGAPLNLLSKAASWILGKFGWENASKFFRDLDVEQGIRDAVGAIGRMVSNGFDWLVGIFNKDKMAERMSNLWEGVKKAFSFTSFGALLFGPIGAAIEFVVNAFKWNDDGEPFRLKDFVWDKFIQAKNWISGLFDWATPENMNWTNLKDYAYGKWIGAKEWLQGLFRWDLPTVEDWTNLKDYAYGKWIGAKEWLQGLFRWDLPTVEDWTNLKDFINDKWIKAKSWISGLFSWANPDSLGWTSLSEFVSGKWTETKQWIMKLLAWDTNKLANDWKGLTSYVGDKWSSVKNWFSNVMNFDKPNEKETIGVMSANTWSGIKSWFSGAFTWNMKDEDKDMLAKIFRDALQQIKDWFVDLFDFLPSVDDVKNSLLDAMPAGVRKWFVKTEEDIINDLLEERKDLQNTIKNAQEKISDPKWWHLTDEATEKARIAETLAKLKELEEKLTDRGKETPGASYITLSPDEISDLAKQLPTALGTNTDAIGRAAVSQATSPANVNIAGGSSIAKGGDIYRGGDNIVIHHTAPPEKELKVLPE